MTNERKIIDILTRFEITYWLEGKNVSRDSINIQCPFCDDHSNHLGIFEDSLLFSCWICNKKGPFVYLLSVLTGLTDAECEEIIDESGTSYTKDAKEHILGAYEEDEVKERRDKGRVVLPRYFEKVTTDTDFSLLHDWMERRDISLTTLIKYGCGICKVGPAMNRLIIPVFSQQKLVAYQALDLTGFARVKYRTSIDYINDYLYGHDDVLGERMVVTEGVLDAWRIGEGAVATFGTSLTEKQRNLILEKGLKEFVFAWDGDAYWKALKEVEFFGPFIEEVRVVKFPEGEDPDSFGKKYGRDALVELVN